MLDLKMTRWLRSLGKTKAYVRLFFNKAILQVWRFYRSRLCARCGRSPRAFSVDIVGLRNKRGIYREALAQTVDAGAWDEPKS